MRTVFRKAEEMTLEDDVVRVSPGACKQQGPVHATVLFSGPSMGSFHGKGKTPKSESSELLREHRALSIQQGALFLSGNNSSELMTEASEASPGLGRYLRFEAFYITL